MGVGVGVGVWVKVRVRVRVRARVRVTVRVHPNLPALFALVINLVNCCAFILQIRGVPGAKRAVDNNTHRAKDDQHVFAISFNGVLGM